MSRTARQEPSEAEFFTRRKPPPPALRGLDALSASLIRSRPKPLATASVGEASAALCDFEEICRLGHLEEQRSEFIASALEAAGDGIDQTVASAAAALLTGDLVEGLSTSETERACAIAAIAFGWRPAPCHVIAPDAGSAERWADGARALCSRAGLTLTVIQSETTPAERRKAYTADIVAVASRTLMADYARDLMTLGALADPGRRAVAQLCRAGRFRAANTITRGLGCALLLDAAQTLFDDAGSPVRLTQSVDHPLLVEQCRLGIEAARSLSQPEHFSLRSEPVTLSWTDAGERALAEAPVHRDFVMNAVRAIYLLEKGRHYTVSDNELVLQDDASGRQLDGRSFRQGLQQTVEILENLPPSPLHESVVQTSVPEFYRSPSHLAGCAINLDGLHGELFQYYRCKVLRARPPTRLQAVALYSDEAQLIDETLRLTSAAAGKRAIVTGNKLQAETLSRALRAEVAVTCPEGDSLPSPPPRAVMFAKLPASRRSACTLLASFPNLDFHASLDDPLIAASLPDATRRIVRLLTPKRRKIPVPLAWLVTRTAWRKAAKLARKQRAATYHAGGWGRSILGRSGG